MKQYWVKTFFKWICSYFHSLQQWQKSITFATHTMGFIIAQCRRRHFQWIKPCIHHQLHSMSVRMQLVKMDRKKVSIHWCRGNCFMRFFPIKSATIAHHFNRGRVMFQSHPEIEIYRHPLRPHPSPGTNFPSNETILARSKKKERSSVPETGRECCRVVLSSSFFSTLTHPTVRFVWKPFEDLLR